MGLTTLADVPHISNRAKTFYATFAALIDDAITQGSASQDIPMNGEPIVLQEHEGTAASFPAEPTLFAGRWEFKNSAQPRHATLERKEQRLTAPAVYSFVMKARDASLPLPPGVIDWLVNAPLESEATFETTTYKTTFNVTRR
jgi:hypothetical protein